MPNHFPNPASEAGGALKKVGEVVMKAKGNGLIDTGMNKATKGLVEAGKQAIVFPINALVKPTAKTLNDLAVGTAKFALGFTWDLIKSRKWIPMPGGRKNVV